MDADDDDDGDDDCRTELEENKTAVMSSPSTQEEREPKERS